MIVTFTMENPIKTVLVTGGAGFIGSTYLNLMVPKYPEYRFVNVDTLTGISDITNVTVDGAVNYVFEKADIRDISALQTLFAKYHPTHIINFAAETHVDQSIHDPRIFLESNVIGTGNLLLCALEHGVTRFHQISTDEVYGSLEKDESAFTEDSQVAPRNPYSASKASADHLVQAFHNTYGLDVVITRCSNNYGPRQDATKFIPRAIISLMRGEKIPVYGKGENVRDWIHAEDHARAVDLVFHTGTPGEVYNVGTDNEWQNIDIARTLIKIFEKDESAIEFVPDRLGHDLRYAIDSSKVTALGWKPEIPFEEGLRDTVTWYCNRSKGA